MALFNMSQPQQPGMNMPGMQTPDMQPINYQPQMPAPQQAPQANPFSYQHQKPSIMGIIADGLSGAAGQPGRYGEMLSQQGQTQRMMAMQSMHIQQQQSAEFARQDLLQKTKVPDIQRQAEYYRSLGRNDLAETLLKQNALHGGSPFGAMWTNPATGEVSSSGGPATPPPAGPVGALTDYAPGGQTPPASGTFQR